MRALHNLLARPTISSAAKLNINDIDIYLVAYIYMCMYLIENIPNLLFTIAYIPKVLDNHLSELTLLGPWKTLSAIRDIGDF